LSPPVEVRLDRLLFPRPVPAGMDWSVVGLHACQQRKTADPVNPRVEVRPIDGTPFYRLEDGRHRFVAALMSGRQVILADVGEPMSMEEVLTDFPADD
jgi:hypothetical protein